MGTNTDSEEVSTRLANALRKSKQIYGRERSRKKRVTTCHCQYKSVRSTEDLGKVDVTGIARSHGSTVTS
jgi:hypothetical protein